MQKDGIFKKTSFQEGKKIQADPDNEYELHQLNVSMAANMNTAFLNL